MKPSHAQPPFHPTQSSLSRGSALLVDEDEKDLEYFAALMSHLGYAVRHYANYQEAERRLEQEPFDFVIVSQGSPAFEARRLVEIVLARNRETPVVVLSRCLEMNCYIEAMQLGAADYLEKPLAPAEFECLVTTHCQPRQSTSSACAS